MSSIADFPKQRSVYLCKALKQSGDTKKRAVVVVSIDIRNQYSSTVLVVPFSSDISQAANPSRTLIKQAEGGLNVGSVAMCDVLTCIKKQYLEPEPYGEISEESFARILQAIQIAMGIY
ncbi:MAG: type II toxin-antitoxin system PemK/MazF family toxin [Cyanobacteria bacterium P01_G01_bin.67]